MHLQNVKYVKNYVYLKAVLHVSVIVRHLQGESRIKEFIQVKNTC